MNVFSIKANLQIGKVIQNALVFNFKNLREVKVNTENLLQTIDRLFVLLEERKIEYLLVGGVALLQYIESRNTEDIDLIMDLSSLKKMPEIVISSQDAYFAHGKFNEVRIDIILKSNPLFNKVHRQYATIQHFVERDIPCASVDGLLLLKLYALPELYRLGNFARMGIYENDLAIIIHDFSPQLEPLFEELAHHLSVTDLAAVHEIVKDIQQRIERFGKGLDKNRS